MLWILRETATLLALVAFASSLLLVVGYWEGILK